MKVKEQAKHAKAQEKIQHPVHAPGENGAVATNDKVPIADVEKIAVPPATGNEDTEEIPIAGRTKMTVPKKANQDSQSDIVLEAKSKEEKEQEESASREQGEERKKAEATTELNAILKRSPGMSSVSVSYPLYSWPKLTASSGHLFQILLSLQQKS